MDELVNLPKVNPNTKTYFGRLCYKHPEDRGFRYISCNRCIRCQQKFNYNGSIKLVPHPNGSGKIVTQTYAYSVKLVPHPDGSGQMVKQAYANSKRMEIMR
jgi:hypothetical protein